MLSLAAGWLWGQGARAALAWDSLQPGVALEQVIRPSHTAVGGPSVEGAAELAPVQVYRLTRLLIL